MQKTSLKIAGLSALAIAFTAGTAMAGAGKDCNHKKKTEVKSEASMTPTTATAVMGVSATSEKTMTGKHKAYTFDDALKLCTEKGAADLQACIDYKTGKVAAKPAS